MHKYSCTLLFSLFFLCSIAAYAQDTTGNGETSITLPAVDEAAIQLQEEPARQALGSSSTAALLFQLVVWLAVVCALVYAVLYFIRRSRRFTAGDDPFLKNVAALPLSPNKTVYIITLVDKAYISGASDASLSLIAEINDKELIDAMNLHAAQKTGPKQDFNTFLHTFFPAAKPKAAENNLFDSFLTKQRERLQKPAADTESTRSSGADEEL